MNTKILRPGILTTACLMLPMLLLGSVAPAQQPAPSYPTMAPLDQYLMPDRDAEIALARSAAPASVSRDAEVLVLARDGYHTAVPGKNGFTCMVERAWMSPIESSEFWNPKMRGPVCYNPQASRSILPYTILRTNLVLKGLSKEEVGESMKAALEKNQIPLPESGAMSYMMSKDGYLGDQNGHWHPHLMFHIPQASAASWGANMPDSPIFLIPPGPEPESIFLVPLDHWSDGTPAHEGSDQHQH